MIEIDMIDPCEGGLVKDGLNVNWKSEKKKWRRFILLLSNYACSVSKHAQKINT